jgi:hypothetical protein
MIDIHDHVQLIYGTRAWLYDLQQRQARGDRSPGLRSNIEQASRALEHLDQVVIALAQADPNYGKSLYDEIKATHNGSVQRLSQRIKDQITQRS